jgi:hypothetical protein
LRKRAGPVPGTVEAAELELIADSTELHLPHKQKSRVPAGVAGDSRDSVER